MNYSYDDLYGVDLETYLAAHDTSIEQLIEKVDIDIDLLKARLEVLMGEDWINQDNALITYVYNLIKKKQEHKERLNEWLR